MKKLICGIFSFIFTLNLCLGVFATISTIAVPEVDASELLYDYADLLDNYEEEELRADLQELKILHKMSVVVVTLDDEGIVSSAEFADNFFDYNDFGDDGLVLLVNMGTREIWISTAGKAIMYFPDDTINDLTNDIAENLGDEKYAQAVEVFIEVTDKILRKSPQVNDIQMNDAPQQIQDEPISSFEAAFILAIPAGLIFGAIVTIIALLTHNSLPNVTKTTASYVTDGKVHLTKNSDVFLNSSVTKTKIESNSSNASGRKTASVHHSSSGKTHGGGGRKF